MAGAVETEGLDLEAEDRFPLPWFEPPALDEVLRPLVHPDVEGIPVIELFRQAAPLAAMQRSQLESV